MGAFQYTMHGLNALMPIATTYTGIKEGRGVIQSVGRAGVEFLAWESIAALAGGGPMLALMGVQLGIAGVTTAMELGRENTGLVSKNYGAQFGGRVNDNKRAYTSRQRGMAAIAGGSNNVRQVMGSEARNYIRSL